MDVDKGVQPLEIPHESSKPLAVSFSLLEERMARGQKLFINECWSSHYLKQNKVRIDQVSRGKMTSRYYTLPQSHDSIMINLPMDRHVTWKKSHS